MIQACEKHRPQHQMGKREREKEKSTTGKRLPNHRLSGLSRCPTLPLQKHFKRRTSQFDTLPLLKALLFSRQTERGRGLTMEEIAGVRARFARHCPLILLHAALLSLSVAVAGAFDYADALKKSLLYFEAQRSGRLPYTQRVKWRDHSGLTDGLEQGVSKRAP